MATKTRRVVTFILLSFLALLVGAVLAGWLSLIRSIPVTDGTLQAPDIGDSIEITFDSLGIPQIWAQSETDAYYALGYQHAADRMFQMDLTRRVAQGRLSEMLGEATFELDLQQRKLGHARLARAAEAELSERDRARLQAYVDGVNGYVATCRGLPFEYTLLPVTFEPWTMHDCLSALSFQTWFSNALMSADRRNRRIAEKVGEDRANEYYIPRYPGWAPVTIPSSNEIGGRPDEFMWPDLIRESGDRFGDWPELAALPLTGLGPASNAWAVAPERSSSGHAMLASDPHLELARLPQFWYAVGLHVKVDGLDVLGITTPGVPFVVMGHNGRAAWAFTVAGVDVIDYFVENIAPADTGSFMTLDGPQPFEYRQDTIVVSGREEPYIEVTRLTHHGPIVDSLATGQLLSMHWAGFDVSLADAIASGFELHHVSEFESFRWLVTSLGALDASWMYADSAGHIGYQVGTPIPQRPDRGGAFFPRPGWTGEFDWLGLTPVQETPFALDPERGWLAVCNNKASRSHDTPGNYAHDRIIRIGELLAAQEKHSVDDFQSYQMDRIDVSWRRWQEFAAGIIDAVDSAQLASVVRSWDGACDSASAVYPLIRSFADELQRLTLGSELGEQASAVARSAFEHSYFTDTGKARDFAARYDHALQAARSVANRPGPPAWGDRLSLTMRHPMAQVPVIKDLLGLERGPFPWSGSPGCLNAAYADRTSDSTETVTVGASWRFVIDFADVDAATMVLPAGNSGNPMSEHFFDFFEMYRSGARWNVPFSRDAVAARAVSTLWLVPVDSTDS